MTSVGSRLCKTLRNRLTLWIELCNVTTRSFNFAPKPATRSATGSQAVTETYWVFGERARLAGIYLAGETLLGQIRGINTTSGERVSVNHSHCCALISCDCLWGHVSE